VDEPDTYDEFGLFEENAAEAGLTWSGPPAVRREAVAVDGERRVSALVWASGQPELVLIHGGAQNAHTWDTVALALGRPLVAVDLPGHGHSDWRDDHDYWPQQLADDVAAAIQVLAPRAQVVVGMSLGGLTALSLTQRHPELVAKLVIVDVTPGTDAAKAEPIVAFISGPERFDSFQDMLDRTIAYNPTRSVSSLRRGVLHNAKAQPDGSWSWRWDPTRRRRGASSPETAVADFGGLWEAGDAVGVPLTLVRGSQSGVVGDEDIAELLRRQPSAQVVVIEGAGHSVQGDRPVELAQLLGEILAAPPT
jgi:pimeloyl-ACP methyl ester carboxylesterase